MADFVNLSAYRFTPLEDLPALRDRVKQAAEALGLKGTVLLSREGINLFVAGRAAETTAFVEGLRTIPGLEDLQPKESLSRTQPFGHMRVKIKREIISFGVEGIDPARQPAPRLDPEVLREWLDAGKPVTMLDTRNDYEVDEGTFRGALRMDIRRFRDFPSAVSRLPAVMKDQPIVTFCTGGIRCEKAAPLLLREGFREVYQLDGGILKYFERCGGAHFEGTCYVFDERTTLDAELKASGEKSPVA